MSLKRSASVATAGGGGGGAGSHSDIDHSVHTTAGGAVANSHPAPASAAASASASSATSITPKKSTINSEDFTRTVKKRLANTTRTGQACDRCKIRKIRCDGLSGGCSPCRQNSTECRTTDRISHRAVPRGYIEQLEKKCADYEARIKDMEAAFAAAGIRSTSGTANKSEDVYAPDDSSTGGSSVSWVPQTASKDQWRNYGDQQTVVKTEQQTLPYAMDYSSATSSSRAAEMESESPTEYGRESPEVQTESAKRPEFLIRKSGAQHVGMYSGNSYLASTRASALSVLGISIDLADLQGRPEPARSQSFISVHAPAEFTENNPLDDSIQSFLMSISRHAPPSVLQLTLPDKEEALMLIEWHLMATHPYLPILHKPTFMAEFHRMFDNKEYKTTPAHLVIVHMSMAMALYFMAKRSGSMEGTNAPDTARAFRHYHFSLSFVPLLLAGGTLEDIQALLHLQTFTRGFMRPGPAYMLSKMIMSMVFELRLHRSLKKQHTRSGTKLNVLEDELRKRAFWIAMSIDVGISSKLNRPIGVSPDDYDVELPERIEDEYITEEKFTQTPPGPDVATSIDIAFGLFRIAEFTIEIHSKLYAAERPSKKEYLNIVQTIEAKMTTWKDGLPSHLRYDPKATDIMRRMQSSNLMLWYHELRILLRHPSLNLSPSPSFSSDNLTICVESSRVILDICDILRKENNLDSAWYAASVPLLACMTLLFAIWEKRDSVTQNEIARVRADMDLSVVVMKDFGKQAGAENKLGDIILSLTEGTMKMLKERHGNRPTTNGNPPKRASISLKTFTPPIQTKFEVQPPHPQQHQTPVQQQQHHHQQQQQQQQQAMSHNLMAQPPKAYPYEQQPQQQQPQLPPQQLYTPHHQAVSNINNIPTIAHSHVDLHGTNYTTNTSPHHQQHQHHIPHTNEQVSATAALAAVAASQTPHHQAYFIPHTSAAAETRTNPYIYDTTDGWQEYLATVANSFVPQQSDTSGLTFPATALMSLGGPRNDGQWGFIPVYDFAAGAGGGGGNEGHGV